MAHQMRAKTLSLIGIALAGAVALIAGAQTWVSFMVEGVESLEAVSGHELNAALSPVALATVAAALALTIAGRVFRRVLGLLVALLGAGLTVLTWSVLVDPLRAITGKVAELTGITGSAAVSGVAVTGLQVSPWAYAGLVAGVFAALLGVCVLFLSGKWGAAGRKYEVDSAPVAAVPQAARGDAPDRISDWDALTGGEDPT